ncbi:MAG: hypothetical protein JNL58_29050 [Planctomyces sp.]|nr:hypothetical protein [Planctomyces sp.]
MIGIAVCRSMSEERGVVGWSWRMLVALSIILGAHACSPCIIPAQELDLVTADQLFQLEKWFEARLAYDDVAKNSERKSLRFQEATQGAVRSSLRLRDWTGALDRTASLIPPAPTPGEPEFEWWSDEQADVKWQAHLQYLEFTYALLIEIEAASHGTPGDFPDQLIAARISLNQRLHWHLDPPPDQFRLTWDSSLPDVNWWWDGVAEAQAYLDSDERYSRHGRHVGIALSSNGEPLFLEAPERYSSDLPRSKKLLFVISEIEQLDTSPTRDAAAAALLARAQVMRRLYGPQTDVDWQSDEFSYRFHKRPSNVDDRESADVKEFWELADNEARTNIGERSRVITLPESQSPLALIDRLIQKYPDSNSVRDAIHERGLYYQSRLQFAKALDAYRDEVRQFPTHPLVEETRAQMARIEQRDVILGRTGIYAAGVSPKLWFACRNADSIDFAASRFDLDKWSRESGSESLLHLSHGRLLFSLFSRHDDDETAAAKLRKFAASEAEVVWTQQVEKSDRVASHSTFAPLTNAGVYLVEARVPGTNQRSVGLVVVSGIAIIQKPMTDRILMWAVDAQSGTPLDNQEIRVVERSWSDKRTKRESILKTDPTGIAEYRNSDNEGQSFEGYVFAASQDRGATFGDLANRAYDQRSEPEFKMVALLDRPLYRPGDTVNFRVWVRELSGRIFHAAEPGRHLQISVIGPNYTTIRTLFLDTDESGSVVGSFTLGSETPLGAYGLNVEAVGMEDRGDAVEFSVEEYRPPEFEVTVSPTKSLTRPGDPISASIVARYHFGLPVAGGEVSYRIFRQQELQSYMMPAEYDWLYGAGYGAVASKRDEEIINFRSDWRDFWRRYRGSRPTRDIVEEGHTKLDSEGKAEIRFDPSASRHSEDRDWRYTIEASVQDESRRTVDGVGLVVASRQEFYAFAELNRGWYEPGDAMVVHLILRSANDVPVAASGTVSLHRLGDEALDDELRNPKLEDWDVTVGADGRHQLELIAPSAGRYQLRFLTLDSLNREVSTSLEFLVHGQSADVGGFQWPHLQIIPDRRSYQVGDTARLLIVSDSPEAQVLLHEGIDAYRFVSLKNHTRVIELLIKKEDVPNRFFEVTVVSKGAVHTESCQLFIPPVNDLLNLELLADERLYQPGESETFRIKVTDSVGRPVSGDLALTVFDKAVSYIQPESTPGPRSLIVSCKLGQWDWGSGVDATLNPRLFGTSGEFMCPEYYLTDGYKAEIGMMTGTPPGVGDPGDADATIVDELDSFLELILEGDVEKVSPVIRSDFGNTALWLPHLKLDESGLAEFEVKFPQSLTTWHIRGFLITKDTRVGEITRDAVTSKNLLVRLQHPRFLVEKDQVTLSANVHNTLPTDKMVTAELIVPSAVFQATNDATADSEGNLCLTAQAIVPSGGQHRFDWRLDVVDAGLATVTVRSLTDEESDAMTMAIPVRGHGSALTVTKSGTFGDGETGRKTLVFDVPEDAHPQRTRIAVSISPTSASAAFEAIPFLVGYPYGCVEQTMSRFYPTVLVAKTLSQFDIDIADIAERSGKNNLSQFPKAAPDTVLDAAELERMTEAGLQRLQKFQHEDGGWGWWEHDKSSPYMTAYVLIGLHVAAESGATVDESVFTKALDYLAELGSEDGRDFSGSRLVRDHHTDMLVLYALSLSRPKSFIDPDTRDRAESRATLMKNLFAAFEHRNRLTVYDQLLLAMALQNMVQHQKAVIALNDVLQRIERDEERDIAHVPVLSSQHWHSWNNEIETNAWLLRVLIAIEPKNPLAPKLVNWLASNRTNGRFWRSTKDTALAITAISEYLILAGVKKADQTLEIRLDDGPTTQLQVSGNDLLGLETVLAVPGDISLRPGRHELTVERTGSGMMHFVLDASFLRTTAIDQARGNGLTITRRYFRLPRPDEPATANVRGLDADVSTPESDSQPLTMDDTLNVGDIVEVELTIESDDDYEYVAFEDLKPAGCEAVQLRSGDTWGNGLWANVELRDNRVEFFVSSLHKGKHVLKYKLRAETPGWFHALPARGFAMYAPEIHAQSDELRLRVTE